MRVKRPLKIRNKDRKRLHQKNLEAEGIKKTMIEIEKMKPHKRWWWPF